MTIQLDDVIADLPPESRDRVLAAAEELHNALKGAGRPMTETELDTLRRLDEMRTEEWGGRSALFHWLIMPNRSLGGQRPCDRLAEEREAIVASFAADMAEPFNG